MRFNLDETPVQRNVINPLTPNDHYKGRTAPLTSKRFILYIYSTNIGIEYFKHCIYSPFRNAVCFIILKYLVFVLFTFYIKCVIKFKKNNSGAKLLILSVCIRPSISVQAKRPLSILNKLTRLSCLCKRSADTCIPSQVTILRIKPHFMYHDN